MGLLIIGFLFFCTASSNLWVGHGHGQNTFDVLSYGAKGDGVTDDSRAFLEAWAAACGSIGETTPTLVVPEGHSFTLQPTDFKGPCKSKKIDFQILGTILAHPKHAWQNPVKDSWIVFSSIDGLNVYGSGLLDGQGSEWWSREVTPRKELYGGLGSKRPGPTSLRFELCKDLQVSGIKQSNSPGRHIDLFLTSGVTLSNLNMSSPGDSPNTDGIDVSHSSYVSISNSFIGVGDDCIAIKGNCSYVNISRIACGPGHGISVGSLQGDDTVEEVHVWDCCFDGATNGARIKTWAGGRGYARKISFAHMRFRNTRYPIIIDQQYVDSPQSLQEGGIKVSDISYYDFQGTCAEERAISLNCGSLGCSNISMCKIDIKSADPKRNATAVCSNAQGLSSETVPPVQCLYHQALL